MKLNKEQFSEADVADMVVYEGRMNAAIAVKDYDAWARALRVLMAKWPGCVPNPIVVPKSFRDILEEKLADRGWVTGLSDARMDDDNIVLFRRIPVIAA